MQPKNDENRVKTRRSKKIDHVVETRSRTRASFGVVQNGGDAASLPSSSSTGILDVGDDLPGPSLISPRKMKELHDLAVNSSWQDPVFGKHQRTTRRSMLSQQTATSVDQVDAQIAAVLTSVVAPKQQQPPSSTKKSTTNGFIKAARSPTHSMTPVTASAALAAVNGKSRIRRRMLSDELNVEQPKPKRRRRSPTKAVHRTSGYPRIHGKRRRHTGFVRGGGPRLRFRISAAALHHGDPEGWQSLFVRTRHGVKKPSLTACRLRQSDAATTNPVVTNFVKRVSGIVDSRFRLTSFLPDGHVDKTFIRRRLRLKKPQNAIGLLPIPRSRLGHPKSVNFGTASKNRYHEVKNQLALHPELKWLALVTPCQRSCNCRGFRTTVKAWTLEMPTSEAVERYRMSLKCIGCHHPIWQHRRKVDASERGERYILLQDLFRLQKMHDQMADCENRRIMFQLFKDFLRILIENHPMPREVFPDPRTAFAEPSVRECIEHFMHSREARKLEIPPHVAENLIETLNRFRLPNPDSVHLLSPWFLRPRFKSPLGKQYFVQWYRYFYGKWTTYCRLAEHLDSLPTMAPVDLFDIYFLSQFDELFALNLEEQYVATKNPEVKMVAVLFRYIRQYADGFVDSEGNALELSILKSKDREQLVLGKGFNVLESGFVWQSNEYNDDGEYDEVTSRLIVEPSGPYLFDRFDYHNTRSSYPILEAREPLLFARIFVERFVAEHFSAFLDHRSVHKNRNQKKSGLKRLAFCRDPVTLSDLVNIDSDISFRQAQGVFTNNCDLERAGGQIEVICLRNTLDVFKRLQTELLMQFVTVIHRQLPKMPKHYIIRLVMSPKHRSLVLVKHFPRGVNKGWRVLGGICFRPFFNVGFSEVVFVAVHADHQVRGYGGYLMNHLKKYHVEQLGYPHLLTFADKNAHGYFRKQGFSTDLGIEEEAYDGYIKLYKGAILMYCQSRYVNTLTDMVYWTKLMIKLLETVYDMLCPEWKTIYGPLRHELGTYRLLPIRTGQLKDTNYGASMPLSVLGLPTLYWVEQYRAVKVGYTPDKWDGKQQGRSDVVDIFGDEIFGTEMFFDELKRLAAIRNEQLRRDTEELPPVLYLFDANGSPTAKRRHRKDTGSESESLYSDVNDEELAEIQKATGIFNDLMIGSPKKGSRRKSKNTIHEDPVEGVEEPVEVDVEIQSPPKTLKSNRKSSVTKKNSIGGHGDLTSPGVKKSTASSSRKASTSNPTPKNNKKRHRPPKLDLSKTKQSKLTDFFTLTTSSASIDLSPPLLSPKKTILIKRKRSRRRRQTGKEKMRRLKHHQKIAFLLESTKRCPFSWPFHFPVDEYDAPDYSDEILIPMTLEIMQDRFNWGYYVHERLFFADMSRMFLNCYVYNMDRSGHYYHACYRLHQYFNSLATELYGHSIAPYLMRIPLRSLFRETHGERTNCVFDPVKPYWYPILDRSVPPVVIRTKKASSGKRRRPFTVRQRRRHRKHVVIASDEDEEGEEEAGRNEASSNSHSRNSRSRQPSQRQRRPRRAVLTSESEDVVAGNGDEDDDEGEEVDDEEVVMDEEDEEDEEEAMDDDEEDDEEDSSSTTILKRRTRSSGPVSAAAPWTLPTPSRRKRRR